MEDQAFESLLSQIVTQNGQLQQMQTAITSLHSKIAAVDTKLAAVDTKITIYVFLLSSLSGGFILAWKFASFFSSTNLPDNLP